MAVTDYLVKSNAAERSEFGSIGEGQTWQDMTAARAKNVDETNNTGMPIQVSITAEESSPGDKIDISLQVDGLIIQRNQINPDGNTAVSSVSAVVPAGSTYKFIALDSSDNVIHWAELR